MECGKEVFTSQVGKSSRKTRMGFHCFIITEYKSGFAVVGRSFTKFYPEAKNMNWRQFIKDHDSTVSVPKIKAAKMGYGARRATIPNRGSATLLAMLR